MPSRIKQAVYLIPSFVLSVINRDSSPQLDSRQAAQRDTVPGGSALLLLRGMLLQPALPRRVAARPLAEAGDRAPFVVFRVGDPPGALAVPLQAVGPRPRVRRGLAPVEQVRCRLVAAVADGSRTGTPAGSKCRTLRVTTVRPCSSAVAAMSRSALSWPRRPDRRPHRRAAGKSTARIRSPYSPSKLSLCAWDNGSSPGTRSLAQTTTI